MTIVLNASALLAYLKGEPAGDRVDAGLTESVMSSVNWTEVVQKSIVAGVDVDGMLDDLQALGLVVERFMLENSELAQDGFGNRRASMSCLWAIVPI